MTASDQIDMMKRTNTTPLGEPAHVVPEIDRAETDRLILLKNSPRLAGWNTT